MKQTNMKKHEIWASSIPVDIFRSEVIVLITNSREYLMEDIEAVLTDDLGMKSDYAKEFSEALRNCLKDEDPLPLGLTYEIPCSDCSKENFVILNGTPKSVSKDTIIHEMYHAMKRICNDRSVDDEETEAYMLEYLCHEYFDKVATFTKEAKKP